VSKPAFITFLSQHLRGFGDFVQDGLAAIYESSQIYGDFPFSPETENSSGLSYEQLLRAVAFMWDRQPYFPHSTFYTHERFMGGFGDMSGDLGPHHGWYVHSRHRGHQDRRRLDFRALAVKIPSTEHTEKELKYAKIPITYFWQLMPDDGYDDRYLRIGYADDEDERGVDIVDVLNVTYPKDSDPMVPPLMLSSLRSTASELPKQPYYLYEMRIPYSKLLGFVKLLLLVQLNRFDELDAFPPPRTEDFGASAKWITDGFTDREDIGWDAFDEVMMRNLVIRINDSGNEISRWLI
jgi:hypothetical protein